MIDYTLVHKYRQDGVTWENIAAALNTSVGTVSKGYTRWRRSNVVAPEFEYSADDLYREATLSDLSAIESVDDLAALFGVDTDEWAVDGFRLNSWDAMGKGGVPHTMYQVRATFKRNVAKDVAAGREALAEALAEIREHAPLYHPVEYDLVQGNPENVLYEVALMDPHLGMYAWASETGQESWDLALAVEAYTKTARQLIALARNHPVERILLVMGNDTLHVDTVAQGKVGTTTAGTPQDVDSRLPKLFTAARQAMVEVIDEARLVAPVDVLIVPGNHDEHSMYRLGEVLAAWYRLDENVVVLNTPARRKYYAYGENLLGFTHGQEFKRKRDPLPLIMATEAPKLWGASSYREIHCGHFHGAAERTLMSPEDTVTDVRAIRMRVLPALTPLDAWHSQEGYLSHRAATAMAFKRSGGLVALYEVQP